MDITIQDGVSSFLVHCKVKNLDPKSILFYQSNLKNLVDFLELKANDFSIQGINPSVLREFILYLRNEKPQRYRNEKGITEAGINRHIKVLKIFFKFLEKEGIIKDNPTRNIPKLRVEHKKVEAFKDIQITQMLEVAKNRGNFSGYRDYLLIHLLYDTGARISELLGLKNEAINHEERVFHVIGKGRKPRDVPFGRTSYEILCQYLKMKDDKFGANDKIFVSSNGNALTRRQAAKNIERIGKKAEIQGVRVSPHTFRHTFAKSYLLNGGDVFSLKEILGHNDLETVQIYVNLNQKDIVSQYCKYNPGDKLAISML